MKCHLISFFALILITLGCTDRDDELTAVNLRVKNVSSLTFDRVQVGAADKVHTHLVPGAFSDYLLYEKAYRYAYIAITAGEETFVLQPIDFVGETELPLGFYTYELNVLEGGDVVLEFVVD